MGCWIECVLALCSKVMVICSNISSEFQPTTSINHFFLLLLFWITLCDPLFQYRASINSDERENWNLNEGKIFTNWNWTWFENGNVADISKFDVARSCSCLDVELKVRRRKQRYTRICSTVSAWTFQLSRVDAYLRC